MVAVNSTKHKLIHRSLITFISFHLLFELHITLTVLVVLVMGDIDIEVDVRFDDILIGRDMGIDVAL